MENKNKVCISIGIAAIMIFVFMSLPIIPQTVEYQKPVYKTVEHSEPIYQDVYKEVEHSEPIYEKVYTLRLGYDLDDYYVTQNVYDVEYEYLGGDWPEYGIYDYELWNAEVYYYDGYDKKYVKYFNIENQKITNECIEIVGHNTWTESVLNGQEIVGHNIWTETVIDRYTKMERTEYKNVFEIIL